MSMTCTPLPPRASMACSGTALLYYRHGGDVNFRMSGGRPPSVFPFTHNISYSTLQILHKWLFGSLFYDAFSVTRLYSVDDMMIRE
jgi:hypothetical protein